MLRETLDRRNMRGMKEGGEVFDGINKIYRIFSGEIGSLEVAAARRAAVSEGRLADR